MFLCLAAAPSLVFIPTTGHSSARAPVGVVCRAKRARTARWDRAGCSRRARQPPWKGRRWGRNRPRAHLRVADVRSTNGASMRAAAASEAAVDALRRVPAALVRVGPAAGEARTLRRPRHGHRGAPRAPAGAADEFFSLSRSFLVLFARFFFCVSAFWWFSTILSRALTLSLHGRRQGRAQHARAEPQRRRRQRRLGRRRPWVVVVDLGPTVRCSAGAVKYMDRPRGGIAREKVAGPAWHRCRARRRRRSGPSPARHQQTRGGALQKRLPAAARLPHQIGVHQCAGRGARWGSRGRGGSRASSMRAVGGVGGHDRWKMVESGRRASGAPPEAV